MTPEPTIPSSPTIDPAPAASAEPQAVKAAKPADHPTLEASEQAQKKHRTTGNKIFDLVVYPGIAFGLVMVACTKGLNYVKTGKGQQPFEEHVVGPLTSFYKKIPIYGNRPEAAIHDDANNHGKVGVSFLIGTFLMIPIKLLEDRRDQISKWFDKVFSTEPKNMNDYKPEPKQSWKSVLGGRGITFLSVLGLSSIVGGSRTEWVENQVSSRFAGGLQGVALGKIPEDRLEKIRHNTKFLTFELFYTALCTVMVYALSRLIASKDDKKHEAQASTAASDTTPKANTQHALAHIAEKRAEEKTTEANATAEKGASRPASQAVHRPPVHYGIRTTNPADFRTKHEERKLQDSAAMVSV